MMARATEDKLAELHSAVAIVLTDQVTHTADETELNEDGELIPTGEKFYDASPATIAAAIKFLKDNQITCDIKTNRNMTNLKEALDKKQKHSRLPSAKQAALKVVGDE